MRTRDDLRRLQALPLEIKIKMTQRRIRDWVKKYGEDGVYVSFSGGKDSTVLLHIVREMYPDIEAVFVNTGLEYPEIQRFVKTFANVTILRPKMRFDEVIKRYGYPMISKEISQKVHDATNKHGGTAYQKLAGTFSRGEKKNTYYPAGKPHKYFPLVEKVDFRVSHYCCEVMKKRPAKEFEKQSGKKPILATMASESLVREQQWLRSGCNMPCYLCTTKEMEKIGSCTSDILYAGVFYTQERAEAAVRKQLEEDEKQQSVLKKVFFMKETET